MTFYELFDIIERMLKGDYSPWEFSYVFPELLIEYKKVLLKENETLYDEVQENFPDICAELEDDENLYKDFVEKIRKEYERVKAFCN